MRPPSSAGRAWFDHLQEHDAYLARFAGWVLETPEDVERWAEQVETEFHRIGRKVDLLIDLTGLQVRMTAGRAFGQRRAKILRQHTLSSYRFGGDGTTETFLRTSQLLTGAPGQLYPSQQAALEALLADRLKRPGTSPSK